MLRRKFEADVRNGHVFRTLPRLIFYLAFCPLIFLSSLKAGINSGRVAGLLGGLIAIPVGLVLWSKLWQSTKRIYFLRWKRHHAHDGTGPS